MTAVISADYLRLQQQLHGSPEYGSASFIYAKHVKQLMLILQARSLADYGAGKKNLQLGLRQLGLTKFEYFPYDPAFPEYGPPTVADLICCIDVLEHIEPDRLDNVLEELAAITQSAGFFTVHTGPAKRVLPDGRNAHLIQEPASWWLPRLCGHFEIRHLHTVGKGFWVIVEPRGRAQKLVLNSADLLHFASFVQRSRAAPVLARIKENVAEISRVLARAILTPAQYRSLRGKKK